MLTHHELATLGIIPKTGYKMGKAFPKDFQFLVYVTKTEFKKLPLYIQVLYDTETDFGVHNLKGIK